MAPKRKRPASETAVEDDALLTKPRISNPLRAEVAGADLISISAPPEAAKLLTTLGAAKLPRSRWRFPVTLLGRVRTQLAANIELPPHWVLLALGGDFRKLARQMELPKKTARVLMRNVASAKIPSWQEPIPDFKCGEGAQLSLTELRSRDDASLLPYQRDGVEFGLQNRGRVLLGDEMGLGKTVQALIIAAHYAAEWPVLIACPASLCRAWADEAKRWLPQHALGLGDSSIQVINKGSDVPRRLARVLIVSYDLLARNPQFQCCASGSKFRVVICDEAHFLKSTTSQRTVAILPLIKRARRAILITGTPAVNNAAELYPLIDALLPGLLPSKLDFFSRYCWQKQVLGFRRQQVAVWHGSMRPEELHQLLLQTVMIRRLKSEVLTELPAKRRQRVQLAGLCSDAMTKLACSRASLQGSKLPNVEGEVAASESSCEQSLMQLFLGVGGRVGKAADSGMDIADGGRSVLKCAKDVLDSAEHQEDTEQQGEVSGPSHMEAGAEQARSWKQAVAEMARLTCEAKTRAVADYVECLVLSGCRFLLFAHHRTMLDSLEDRLSHIHARHFRIDGSTPLAKRATYVAEFQEGDEIQVALLSIAACGQGLNLQSASIVVFAELHWVVGQMLQAEDRVHRVGQSTSVNVQYLIAPGTLDDAMYEVLNRKYRDTSATLDGARQGLCADATNPAVGGLAVVSPKL